MSKHSLPQPTTQSLQEGGSELARAQADWCRAVDLLADAGRRMARHPVPTGFTIDDVRDIAINIVDKLVDAGLVPDCTDTDDPYEFNFQDSIFDTLMERWAAFLSHFEPCNTDKS